MLLAEGPSEKPDIDEEIGQKGDTEKEYAPHVERQHRG